VLMNNAPLNLSPLYGMPGEGGLTASHYWPDKVRMLHPKFLVYIITTLSLQTSQKSATR
jgi:hypothetical protein